MASPKFHFISGLPRSGSTLLSALLLQNPCFHAGISSPVYGMIHGLVRSWSAGSEIALLVSKEQKINFCRELAGEYHGAHHEVVFGSKRGWCEKLTQIDALFPASKVICCVRDMACILDGFEKLYQQDPFERTRLYGKDDSSATVFDRTHFLAGKNSVVGYTFHALQQAYFSELSNKLIVIQYYGLVSQPLAIMQVLYEQLEEPWFEGHNIEDVRFDAQAFDANLSVPSLHKVRPKVMHYERKPILPPGLFNEFSNSEFWRQSNPTKAAFLRLSR